MRKTKEYEVLTIKLEKKIAEDMSKLCEETRLTKIAAVEKALEKQTDIIVVNFKKIICEARSWKKII